MCGKREKNHLVAGLKCLHEGAWLCLWETEWLCPQVGRLSGTSFLGIARCRGPGRLSPSGTVLSTHHCPLPNVHSDRSQLGVQHHCLIKWCILASCSTHPTTLSGGSVWQNGGKGNFIIQKLKVNRFFFHSCVH